MQGRRATTWKGAATLPPAAALGAAAVTIAALALGAATGVLAGLDRRLGPFHPLWDLAGAFSARGPWLWTATALLVACLVPLTLRAGTWLGRRRVEVAAVLAVASGALSGINVGARDPFELALAVSTAVWLGLVLVEHRPIRTPRWVIAVLMCLSVAALASVINGGVASFMKLHTLWTKYWMMFLIVELLASVRLHRLALRTFVWAALVSAVLAFISELMFVATGARWTFDDTVASQVKATPLGPMLRATAFTPATQTLGHLLIMGLGLLLMMPLTPLKRIAGAGVLLGGVVCTFSTGSILAAFVVLALSPLVHRPAWVLHYLAGVAGVILAVYASGLAERILEALMINIGLGLVERVELVQGGLQVIHQYPALGIGVGNIYRVLNVPVHNAYLQMTSETGLPSGVLFTGLVVTFTAAAVAGAARLPRGPAKQWFKGLALGMIGMAVHCQVNPLSNEHLTYVFMALVLGALLLYRHREWVQGADHEAA